ncbi:hypothetical protein KAR91_02325 [Candidatus Pacearchaeota archaeon]|nr:hypothetical protein [Candidatus Pacearchaeota archaeon]
MKIGGIENIFEIKNFETFQEWLEVYKKEIIDPYSEHHYPDTIDGRSMVNSIVTEINKTIHEKWVSFGCDMPEIKTVITTKAEF